MAKLLLLYTNYVGTTYFTGPLPAKYLQQQRA